MSSLLEDFRSVTYKVSSEEPLTTRKELIREYCVTYPKHYIVESYIHTSSISSSCTILKLEAARREGRRYPVLQDHTIPELHIEYYSLDPAEKQELLDVLYRNRKKHR